MDFKLLCSDLDGTLLSTKSDVSDFTVDQIARIKHRIRVILVSARMPQSMTYVQKRLAIEDQPIICYNGALIRHGQETLFSSTIDFDALKAVYTLAQGLGIQLGLYFKKEWYVETTSERVRKEIAYTRTHPVFRPTKSTLRDWEKRQVSAHKIMLMGTKASADAICPQLVRKFGSKMNVYRSNDTLIELAPREVSKSSAIQRVLQPKETMANVIAFGDNYNDMEMLEQSGLGIAVENARSEVKAVADHVTLSNTEDGVAHYIKQHLI